MFLLLRLVVVVDLVLSTLPGSPVGVKRLFLVVSDCETDCDDAAAHEGDGDQRVQPHPEDVKKNEDGTQDEKGNANQSQNAQKREKKPHLTLALKVTGTSVL